MTLEEMTSVEIEFAVPGQPVPQGSKNAYNRNGRIVLVESARGLKRWRKLVTEEATRASHKWIMPDRNTPIHVSLTFFMERPKSVRRLHPTVKPDLDKTTRACLDAITQSGVIWHDDAQVTVLVATKVYAVGLPLTIISIRS